jgi:hypothetical protein
MQGEKQRIFWNVEHVCAAGCMYNEQDRKLYVSTRLWPSGGLYLIGYPASNVDVTFTKERVGIEP